MDKWEYAITLIGHVNPEKLWSRGEKAQKGNKGEGESLWKEKTVGDSAEGSKKTNTKTALTAEQSDMDKSRTLIEFCCSPDSLLGKVTKQSKRCNVVRLTQDVDVTSDHGIQMAMNSIVGPNTLLWGSIPCTGGCPWQRINKNRPGGEAKLRKHVSIFKKIWESFARIARAVVDAGGVVAIEWPRSCSYWRWPRVKALNKELGLLEANFDGCAFGLKTASGMLIKKPWRVMCNMSSLIGRLDGKKCLGDHDHAPCAGDNTKSTETTR